MWEKNLKYRSPTFIEIEVNGNIVAMFSKVTHVMIQEYKDNKLWFQIWHDAEINGDVIIL